jgi:hypothetical protein
MTPSLPAMSVVLVTPDSFRTIRKTLRHLAAQAGRGRLEILIVVPHADQLGPDPGELECFHSTRIIEVGPIHSVSAARAAAIREAAAPVVVLAEDHSFPEAGWAEALMEAHQGPWAAVGPAVLNGNPGSALSWANFFCCFGQWAEGAAEGVAAQVPWHNSSYKRDLLLAYGEDLPWMLAVEGLLQEDLQAKGHEVYLEPAARTQHLNFSRLPPMIGHSFCGGRLFAATRVAAMRWSPARRLLYIASAPLIPWVRLRRILADIRRYGRERAPLPRLFPALAVSLCAHVLGEVVGYLAGAGQVERRYSYYEMARCHHLSPADRALTA